MKGNFHAKNQFDSSSRFDRHTKPACDRQTDRRTHDNSIRRASVCIGYCHGDREITRTRRSRPIKLNTRRNSSSLFPHSLSRTNTNSYRQPYCSSPSTMRTSMHCDGEACHCQSADLSVSRLLRRPINSISVQTSRCRRA